jgi:hypothetical protein
MAILTQTFEGGSAGTEISSANTTGGGTAISSVKGAGASVAFTTTIGEVIAGSVSCKCFGPSGSAAYANWSGSTTTGGFYAKHRLQAVTTVGAIQVIRTASSAAVQVQQLASGKLVLGTPGGAQYTTPSALSLPGIYFVDIALDTGTSTTDGRIKFAVYDSTGTLTGGMTAPVEFTGINAGAGGAIAYFQAGKCNTTTDAVTVILDDLRALTGTYSLADPSLPAGNITPTANAGRDQTGIEPWSTVTLNASASTDADGTIASYTWRQISGTSVVLSGSGATRSYMAPATLAGETLVFGCTVTDDTGADSAEDMVSHTVLAVTERAVIGGVEVPMRIDEVSQ